VTTVGLPAAVSTANRRPAEVGLSGALNGAVVTPRAVGERTGWALLQDARTRRVVGPLAVVAGAATAALAVSGDREAAGGSALLTALALLAPPSTAFASYFGGWLALRHTARVVDALVADGELPAQRSLPHAVVELGRRSAWAARVGLVRRAGRRRPRACKRQRLRRGARSDRPVHDDRGARAGPPRALKAVAARA
jgi:hypothetical protein